MQQAVGAEILLLVSWCAHACVVRCCLHKPDYVQNVKASRDSIEVYLAVSLLFVIIIHVVVINANRAACACLVGVNYMEAKYNLHNLLQAKGMPLKNT